MNEWKYKHSEKISAISQPDSFSGLFISLLPQPTSAHLAPHQNAIFSSCHPTPAVYSPSNQGITHCLSNLFCMYYPKLQRSLPCSLHPFLSHLLLKPAFIFKDFSTQPFMCCALSPFIPPCIASHPFLPWEGGGSSLNLLFRERRQAPLFERLCLISQVI